MKAAAFWYQRAAEQVLPLIPEGYKGYDTLQGYARAQFAFALLLADGQGHSKDVRQAVHFHRQAAQQVTSAMRWCRGMMCSQGLVDAQFHLAYALSIGQGVVSLISCSMPRGYMYLVRLGMTWRQ